MKNDQALGRHHLRFAKVPAGFIRFRGNGDPIKNDKALVELVIRTAEGLGFAGPRKVHPEEWTIPASEHGSIAAYRLVDSQVTAQPVRDVVA
jgi:hypothetical protein